MCMQDLAISARISYRPVNNMYAVPGSGIVIPPSPIRHSLIIRDAGNGNIPPIRVSDSPTSPRVNEIHDAGSAQNILLGVVTIRDLPGIFNGPLYTTGIIGEIEVWEGVMDSTLSFRVQEAADQMGP